MTWDKPELLNQMNGAIWLKTTNCPNQEYYRTQCSKQTTKGNKEETEGMSSELGIARQNDFGNLRSLTDRITRCGTNRSVKAKCYLADAVIAHSWPVATLTNDTCSMQLSETGLAGQA